MSAMASPEVMAGFSEPAVDPSTFVTTARLAADSAALAARVPPTVDAVAGVARSGLLPAGVIATHLHLPLLTVSRAKGVLSPGAGWRMSGGDPDRPPQHVLIVDDTGHYGAAMADARAAVAAAYPDADITTAVVYAHPRSRHTVDLAHAILDGQHYLEWNWQNAGHGQSAAYDMDGIVCADCPPGHDDEGPLYEAFLRDARPLYLPRRAPVPLIVTGRHERYRPQTLAWLARHGVRVERLVMREFDRPAAADWQRVMGEFKAREFAASACRMFAESEPGQAEVIARRTGLPVLCPEAGRLIHYPPADPVPLRMVVPALAGRVLNGLPVVAACRHEGAVLTPCLTCGDREANHVRACGVYGQCARGGGERAGMARCSHCPAYG